MSEIYLSKHGTEVKKQGGQLLIKTPDGDSKYLPLNYADCLIVMAAVQISYSAITTILRNNGSIIYLSSNGTILGELGQKSGTARLLVRQLKCYLNIEIRQQIAIDIIKKKILSQRNLLRIKNKYIQSSDLKKTITELKSLTKAANNTTNIKTLMGIEGIAAKKYFDAYKIILAKNEIVWQGRNKRPATDPINSMLSFGYSLLEKDVRRAISSIGLNSSIGFLHEIDYRKESLVYDIMEIFRPLIVDRMVLRLIRLGTFTKNDFVYSDNSCLFTNESCKKFIMIYEKYTLKRQSNKKLNFKDMIIMETRNFSKRIRKNILNEPC